MLVKGHGESPVLRKPELDAFLATAMSPELRNVTYLAEMRLEMVTIRGVHLAAIFMQVNKYYLEPSNVPYFPNQFLGGDFFAASYYSKTALILCFWKL